MALQLKAGDKVRGATLSTGYAKIDRVSIFNGAVAVIISIYASQADRLGGTQPLDTVVIEGLVSSLPRSTGASASTVGDCYLMIKTAPMFTGSIDV